MKILSAKRNEDYLIWLNIWENWNGKEIFAHPDYLMLFDEYSDVMCAVMHRDNLTVIYPFGLRQIPTNSPIGLATSPCYDITSPYGYGGLYLIGDGDFTSLLKEFYIEFEKWSISRNIISEFIRFDLFSESREKYNGEMSFNNDNIVCDLRKGKEQIWTEFKSKVRTNVRKAIKSDLKLKLDFQGTYLDDFLKIYYATMDRRNAQNHYYFKREFFESIHEKLSGHFVYFVAEKDGEVISADFVLISDNKIYSFLSANDSNAFQYRANEFIKYHIINWGVENNKSDYVLGGGYTHLDSLYSYKKSFAPNGIIPFYVGKKIYNSELYDQLVGVKEKELLVNSDVLDRQSNFFPLYRLNS